MAATEGVPLPVLPDPVLLRILQLLPPRERLRAARVCRRWKRLALDREVWKHVDLSPYRLNSRLLWHLVRHHLQGSLRTLQLRGSLLSGGKQQQLLSPALLLTLEKRCPQLHLLTLLELNLQPIPYESIPGSLTSLQLKHCELPASWFCSSTSRALPQLQHLLLHHVPAFSDQHLLNISTQSPLKTLTLSGTYRVTDGGLQRAAPHLGALEHLTLRHCTIRDSTMEVLGCYLQNLRFLELTKVSSLTEKGLAALAALQNLETLWWDPCKEISPEVGFALWRELPRLKSLRVGGVALGEEAGREIRTDSGFSCSSGAPA